MASRPDRTFFADFKRFFVRGLAILLPSILTLWLLVAAFRFVETNVGEPINQAMRFAVLQTIPRFMDLDDPNAHIPEWFVVTPPDRREGTAPPRGAESAQAHRRALAHRHAPASL